MMMNNRETYTKQSIELKSKYEQNQTNKSIAFDYAEKLFQLGNFSQSQEILKTLLDNQQAQFLNAQIEYQNGNYSEAEKQYVALLTSDYKAKAEQGLEFVYYQTGQYSKAKNIASPSAIGTMMIAFGDKKPYQIDWRGASTAVIPFTAPEPLPLIEVEIRGEKYNFIIDTGAGDTVLDVELAESLGLESISTDTGVGAGDATATIGYSILDEMILGDIKISELPITMLPTKPFSAFYNNEIEIHGIIGIGVFKQFFTIMDYPTGQLFLYPKDKKDKYIPSENSIDVPFVLAGTHNIISKGVVNGHEINVFMDSGFAVPNVGILLSTDTVRYADIAVSEPETVESLGAGGVTEFQISEFTVDTFKLGMLPESKDLYGYLGVFPESMYFNENGGFFIDSLVSHGFLKQYKWAIDFDSMKMIFV